jgi:ABC-type transport system involved in cytochrome c biogenesis permease subunit
MTWIVVATCLLYAAASLAYFAWLGGLSERVAVWARRGLLAGFIVHTIDLGARGVAGMHPVSSVREAIGFAAWLLAGGFLLVQTRRRVQAVGAFVSPATLVLLLAARLGRAVESGTSDLGVLGRIHISLAPNPELEGSSDVRPLRRRCGCRGPCPCR